MKETTTQFYALPVEIRSFLRATCIDEGFICLIYDRDEKKSISTYKAEDLLSMGDFGHGNDSFVLVPENSDATSISRNEIYRQGCSALFVSIGDSDDSELTESHVYSRSSCPVIQKAFRRVQRKLRATTKSGAWYSNDVIREFYKNLRFTQEVLEFARRGGTVSHHRSLNNKNWVDFVTPAPLNVAGRVVEKFDGVSWVRVEM